MKPCHPLLKCLLLLGLLTNLAHAFYDPGQGRWCSRDPIEERVGSNLYVFSENESVNGIDILGEYASKQAAIDAAKSAVGDAAAKSRELGFHQIEQGVKFLPIDADRDIIWSDAVLYSVARNSGTFRGVAGVEFSTVVYCCGDLPENDRYNYAKPLRGAIPNKNELLSGKEGVVGMPAWPEKCQLLAMLHTHTMTPIWYFPSSGLNPASPSPTNGPPSDQDRKWIGGTVEHYVVQEVFWNYNLVQFK